MLEVARALAARRQDLRHDVIVALFSAEESGLLGSAHYTKARADELKRVKAMINLDMVGRLRGQRLDVLGSDSAAEWSTLVRAACGDLRLQCNLAATARAPATRPRSTRPASRCCTSSPAPTATTTSPPTSPTA